MSSNVQGAYWALEMCDPHLYGVNDLMAEKDDTRWFSVKMTTQPFSRYMENVMSKLNLKALIGVNQIFIKTMQWNKCFVYTNICIYRDGGRRMLCR